MRTSLRSSVRARVATALATAGPAALAGAAWLVVALLAGGIAAAGASDGAIGRGAIDLRALALEDASGRAWPLAPLAGRTLVVVVADRAGSEQSRAWAEGLAAALPGRLATSAESGKATVVSVADLRGVPAVARPMARWIIARWVGDAATAPGGATGPAAVPPLLLDWDGAVASRIEARPDVANVVVLDRDGRAAARERGAASAEALARIAAAVDASLAAGVER
jgi:hypothetical protein